MRKHWRAMATLAVGVATLGSTATAVYAQDDEGPNEVESPVAVGTLDDGRNLLPLAQITIEQAIQAAQGAASGAIGEVDLEYIADQIVYNVDVGDKDVKVDAGDGQIVAVDADD